MKKIICFIFLLCSTSFAGKNEWNGMVFDYDDKYSLKMFTKDDNWFPPGTIVYGSFFGREAPSTKVFRDDMKGVIFIACDLDNAYVDRLNNTVIDGPRAPSKNYAVQNDLRDWEIDKDGKPVKLIDEEYWKALGYDVDVKDIPATPLTSISEIPKAAPLP
jgi:hypothetical protein